MATLTQQQTNELRTILQGRDTIPADFDGYSQAEAVQILQIVYNMPEDLALEHVAFVRREAAGDVIAQIR
jgi:hypothetical protein